MNLNHLKTPCKPPACSNTTYHHRPASMPLAPACWVDAPANCIGASDLARWVNACARWVNACACCVNARARWVRPLRGARWVDVPGLCALGQHPPWMHPAPASAPVLVLVPPR